MSSVQGSNFSLLQPLSVKGDAALGGTIFTPTAGQVGHVMLWNPTASKLLLCKLIVVSAAGSSLGAHMRRVTAAGTNTSSAAKKLLDGNQPAVGQIHTISNAAAQGSIIDSSINLLANTSLILPLDGPIVIPPNVGLAIACSGVTVSIGAHFQWLEING